MNDQPEQQDGSATPNELPNELPNKLPNQAPDKTLPISKGGLLAIALVMVVVYAAGAGLGSHEISKAVGVVLIVAVLALGMWLGFAWVTSAAARDPDSPTVVATRPDAMQAAPLISRLEDHGIQAVATGTHTSGFQVEIASQVRIVVPKRDLARALEVLGSEAGG